LKQRKERRWKTGKERGNEKRAAWKSAVLAEGNSTPQDRRRRLVNREDPAGGEDEERKGKRTRKKRATLCEKNELAAEKKRSSIT